MPKKADVQMDYKCPVCTFPKSVLKNRDFFECDVHKKPICGYCATRLSDLTESADEPKSFIYHRSKSITGVEFIEFKKTLVKATIKELEEKLKAPEEEREVFIREQRKITWQTKEEVIENWEKALSGYTSLLKELKQKE